MKIRLFIPNSSGCKRSWLFFFVFQAFFAQQLSAQKRWDNWYFSVLSGLHIDKCRETVLLDGQMQGVTSGGAGSISDTAGHILFYSNSMSVWNNEHQVMPNGQFTTFWNGITSHYQGPVFVPYPGKDNLYYLIHESRTQVWNDDGDFVVELHYSLIDKNLDGGNGDISLKDQKLYANTTEATAAVMNANNRDYWVVSHMTNNDSFVVYKIDVNGLNTSATYYKIGPSFGNTWRDRQVVIKFSPDRTRMLITRNIQAADPNADRNGGFDLYDFNAATGEISNPIIIRDGFVTETPNSLGRYFSTGGEFSPDSRLIYISTWDKLFQFDISNFNYAAINNSRIMVGNSGFSYGLGQLLIGSNGKIYMSKFYADGYLGMIEYPNKPGMACNYIADAVYFSNASLAPGLGNCIQPYIREEPVVSSDVQISNTCLNDSTVFLLSSSQVDSVKWDFDDPLSGIFDKSDSLLVKHRYGMAQNYQVQLIAYSSCSTDTVLRQIAISNPVINLGNDSSLCAGSPLTLRAGLANASYMWQDGSVADSFQVVETGKYKVTANSSGCFVSDSINVVFKSLPNLSLGADTTICTGQDLQLDAYNPLFSSYQWQDGSATDKYTVFNSGLYWLKVTDNQGCSKSDSIQVTAFTVPGFSLGNDTLLCNNQSIVYNFNRTGTAYLWNDGTAAGNFTISTPGNYWLKMTQNGCSVNDSIEVAYKPSPVVDLGADTLLCEGVAKLLSVDPVYTNVLWNNGSVQNELVVNTTGLYFVKVSLDGCTTADSIRVTYQSAPRFSLGSDTSICIEAPLVLKTNLPDASFLWQDNSTGDSYTVEQPGTYTLTASNTCGTSSSSIVVKQGSCLLVMPNAFTPNRDGKNDLFRAKYPGFIKTFHMNIFNRWGQKVFETHDPQTGWDGTIGGMDSPVGNYVWTIYYEDAAGKIKNDSGFVILIR